MKRSSLVIKGTVIIHRGGGDLFFLASHVKKWPEPDAPSELKISVFDDGGGCRREGAGRTYRTKIKV